MDYAVAQREQATALYREQVLSAFRDVEDQLSALRVLEEEATVQQRAVDAATRSTNLSLLRYKRGLAAYLEVLTNQTIQLTDERAAAALVSRRIVASAQLQMALGGGWTSAQLPCQLEIPQPRRLAGLGVTALSLANTASGSFNPAAAMFCSTWAADDVPGIGRSTGDRRSNHASATCSGLAASSRAASSSAAFASRFCPIGAHGINAIPFASQ